MKKTSLKRSYTGFLPAKQLGLTGKYKAAAVWTLRMLESHEINGGVRKFNMSTVISDVSSNLHNTAHQCGTAACIAGWMGIKITVDGDLKKLNRATTREKASTVIVDVMHSGNVSTAQYQEFYKLFYAFDRCRVDNSFFAFRTAAEGARVLRQFLTTGKGHWPKYRGRHRGVRA